MWLPPLSALLLGPLAECAHCVRLYAALYLLAPGVGAGLLAAPLGASSTTALWLAAPASLGLLCATRVGLVSRSKQVRAWTATLAAVASGTSSIVFAHLLRM